MLEISHEWLKKNFTNPIIFDIGCADLCDTVSLKNSLPKAQIHAFECLDYFRESNTVLAQRYNINYQHVAISEIDGFVDFYPSDELNGKKWPWSGSVCKPNEILYNNPEWKWGEKIRVKSKSLKTICDELNLIPDIIIIDTQGAETRILQSLEFIKPKIIWAEISEFKNYDTKTTYQEFVNLMLSFGYIEIAKDKLEHNALYKLNNIKLTEYL